MTNDEEDMEKREPLYIYYIHILKQIFYVNYGAGTVLDFGVKAMDKESPCPNET